MSLISTATRIIRVTRRDRLGQFAPGIGRAALCASRTSVWRNTRSAIFGRKSALGGASSPVTIVKARHTSSSRVVARRTWPTYQLTMPVVGVLLPVTPGWVKSALAASFHGVSTTFETRR